MPFISAGMRWSGNLSFSCLDLLYSEKNAPNMPNDARHTMQMAIVNGRTFFMSLAGLVLLCLCVCVLKSKWKESKNIVKCIRNSRHRKMVIIIHHVAKWKLIFSVCAVALRRLLCNSSKNGNGTHQKKKHKQRAWNQHPIHWISKLW